LGQQRCSGGSKAVAGNLLPSMYTVGSVPYVNARPLVRFFEEEAGRLPVTVVYDVPSKLPALLESGQADAVLVSSIDSLLSPDRRMAAGIGIASNGPVLSVRLFSRKPFDEIGSLALDQSSLTSNSLAKIILLERFGVTPIATPQPPDLEKMLQAHDACVLIGDIGMRAEGTGLHVLDLGEEWSRLTGLPFVWAVWLGNERLDTKLSQYLRIARVKSCLGAAPTGKLDGKLESWNIGSIGGFEIGEQIERRRMYQLSAISSASSWTLEEVRKYLLETIIFDLGENEIEGLREFGRRLVRHGIAPANHFPQMVEPAVDIPLNEALR
jgi:chorismate dehydratase